jgi:hypothetical protein
MKPTEIIINGIVYDGAKGPSKQPVSDRFLQRLHADDEGRQHVQITLTDLTEFATVYPRAYQVSPVAHGRLHRWMQSNKEKIDSDFWQRELKKHCPHFFNTKEDDERLELEPRRPGPPDADEVSIPPTILDADLPSETAPSDSSYVHGSETAGTETVDGSVDESGWSLAVLGTATPLKSAVSRGIPTGDLIS